MADILHPVLELWSEQEVENGEVINRAWQVRQGVTLQSAEQERGDIVSGTTYYEILSSSITPLKGISQRILRVKGFRSDLWSDVERTDTFRELLNSRNAEITRNRVIYTRRWECDDTAIQEDENGWGASTDSSSVVSQALKVITWESGSVFYPGMVGLPLDYASSTDVKVESYTSPTSITVDISQTTSSEALTFRGQLPAEVGQPYGNGLWSNRIEPSCIRVIINPAFTIKRSLITAQYSAPRRRTV